MKKLFFGMTGVLAVLLVFGLICAGCDTGGGGAGDGTSAAYVPQPVTTGGGDGGGGGGSGHKVTITNIPSGNDGKYIFGMNAAAKFLGTGSGVSVALTKIANNRVEVPVCELSTANGSIIPYTGSETLQFSIYVSTSTSFNVQMGNTPIPDTSVNGIVTTINFANGNATVDWNNP